MARLVADEDAARAIARSAHVPDSSVLTRTWAMAHCAPLLTISAPIIYRLPSTTARWDPGDTVRRRRVQGRPATALPALAVTRDKFEFAEVATDAAAGLNVPRRAEQVLMPRRDAVALFHDQ